MKISLYNQVADILNDNGINCLAKEINVAKGYWTHRHQDAYRWQVTYPDDNGYLKSYGCWYTLTEFVKMSKKQKLYINEKTGEIEFVEYEKIN